MNWGEEEKHSIDPAFRLRDSHILKSDWSDFENESSNAHSVRAFSYCRGVTKDPSASECNERRASKSVIDVSRPGSGIGLAPNRDNRWFTVLGIYQDELDTAATAMIRKAIPQLRPGVGCRT